MLDLLAIQDEFVRFLDRLPDLTAQNRAWIRNRLLDASRSAWKFSVPLPSHAHGRALVAGAGWNNSFLFLGDHFRHTVVWEPHPLRFSILKQLAALLGQNPRFDSGDLGDLLSRLPAQDLIVFENSLSWIPRYLPGRPARSRAALLQKSARLLSDRGECFVSFHSCWAFDRLSGIRAYGSSVWVPAQLGASEATFTSPLDRNDAQANAGRDYSLPGLARTLRDAGLPLQRRYFLHPSGESPNQILGWGNEKPLPQVHPLIKVLSHTGMGKYFYNSPAVVAARNAPQLNFIEELLRHLQEQLHWRQPARVRRNLVSSAHTALFFLDGADGPAILRLPLCRAAQQRMETERGMLEEAARISAPAVRVLIPMVLGCGSFSGQPYLVRISVPGVEARTLLRSPAEYSRLVGEGASILLQWHQASQEIVQVTSAVSEKYFLSYFREARPYLLQRSGSLDRIQSFLEKASAGHLLPLCLMHGDLHFGNLMVHEDTRRLSGILDWDLGETCGLPMLDLFHLLVSKERALRAWTIGETFNKVLLPRSFDSAEQQLIEEHRRALGISEPLLICLMIAYWARHCLGNLVRSGGLKPEGWMQANVLSVLDNLCCALSQDFP